MLVNFREPDTRGWLYWKVSCTVQSGPVKVSAVTLRKAKSARHAEGLTKADLLEVWDTVLSVQATLLQNQPR